MKRLDLYGFKSFGRRVSVELEQGLNAIVGPNGCGKSNLLDAIRWALGEPSARSLRGGRTEDIIFGGTKDVRPLGMAEVVLTFDNTDGALGLPHHEVALTRRAYRSGQSFFAINGVPCRLRDIQDLLARANFGARSHVLVSQGTAETLAVSGGDERRAALDEVAGIARYRHVALLARLARDRALQEMDRAQAVLAEMGRHVAFLERQAARARRAQEVSTALRQVEAELVRREAVAAKAQLEQATSAHEHARAQVDRARALLQEQRTRQQALLAEQERLDRTLDEQARETETARRSLFDKQHELARASDREFQAHERLERAQREMEELRREIEAREADLARSRARGRQLAAALAEAEARHQAVAQELSAATRDLSAREAALEGQRAALLEALESVARARNDLLDASRREQSVHKEREALARRLEELAARRQELASELSDLEQELSEVEELLARRRHEHEEARRALVQAEQAVRAEQERLHRALAEADRLAARARAIEQAFDELEGFSRGVRAIMAAKAPWREAVHGPLAQLIQVPDGLEEAAMAALGAFVEAVVVDSAEAARQAIEYLRERRQGWITLLPLDFLRVRRLDEAEARRLTAMPGVVGLACDLLDVSPALRPALEYATARVLVVESLSDAISAGRQGGGLARIVTRRGEVVVPGGPVSGGHREHSRSELLARRREWRAVRQELEQAVALRRRSEEALQAARRKWQALGEQARALEAEVGQLQARSQAMRARQEALGAEQSRLQREAALLEAQGSRWEAEASQHARAQEELKAHLLQHQQQEQQHRERLGALSADLEAVRKKRQELEAGLVRAVEELEALRAEERVAAAEARRLEQELERLRQRLQQGEAESQAAREEAGRAHALSVELAEEVRALQARLGRGQDDHDRLRQQLSEVRRQLEEVRQQSEHLERTVEAHAGAMARADRGLVTAQERWRQAMQQLRHYLGASVTDPAAVVPFSEELASASRARLEERRRELQAELEQVGPVDLQAIQAYEEARTEYEQRSAGHDDVRSSLARLARWQQELDELSARRLVQALDAASAAFDATIRRLFEGGEGRLRLEGVHPLDSRVQIDVRLPAKRPQPIVALSGGERALVSAAFIFALQQVKPSPLCVFDELDASLDEANLERLLSVVRDMAARRQILFITHRQRTMEAASSLFGVTMDEQGLSRLLVLKLGEVPRVLGGELEATPA
ncbi:chromosome segregation protein SMC [Carboxydochorda subterranea]|uniref:Chromosome partition protein Smc n=1 Tax=Carboxydichorda subterranea TaxID=3109565 RepID=A0ABZ1C0F5_9FIRM|nr:chromosome segregation protein SMC [Limnochorda sp. L945t]WRP18424.1 chromosome segregation protein SMC [Limnochorda sp. L945t]